MKTSNHQPKETKGEFLDRTGLRDIQDKIKDTKVVVIIDKTKIVEVIERK